MDKDRLKELADNPNHIPGIYNYCDRWCERCTFTSRCLTFAMEQEDPQKHDPEANDIENEKFWSRISDSFRLTMEMITEDAERLGIDLDAIPEDPDYDKMVKNRHESARKHPLTRKADQYMKIVNGWFKRSKSLFEFKADELNQKFLIDLKDQDPEKELDIIQDSVDIIQWYHMQIQVKLARAFSSRYMDELDDWDEPDVLNDSDGSAKVSLNGIDRSIGAWGNMMRQFPQEENAFLDILVLLESLRKAVEKEFPNARSFKRPGFDD